MPQKQPQARGVAAWGGGCRPADADNQSNPGRSGREGSPEAYTHVLHANWTDNSCQDRRSSWNSSSVAIPQCAWPDCTVKGGSNARCASWRFAGPRTAPNLQPMKYALESKSGGKREARLLLGPDQQPNPRARLKRAACMHACMHATRERTSAWVASRRNVLK
jgi:hypothetical protein